MLNQWHTCFPRSLVHTAQKRFTLWAFLNKKKGESSQTWRPSQVTASCWTNRTRRPTTLKTTTKHTTNPQHPTPATRLKLAECGSDTTGCWKRSYKSLRKLFFHCQIMLKLRLFCCRAHPLPRNFVSGPSAICVLSQICDLHFFPVRLESWSRAVWFRAPTRSLSWSSPQVARREPIMSYAHYGIALAAWPADLYKQAVHVFVSEFPAPA